MKTTPKDFFLWAGGMVALYASVISFIALAFEYINRAFPDPLQGYVDPYSSAMRVAIATLVVAFPLFLVVMRLIRKEIATEPAKQELWVRRWALGLTLFIAGIALAIDLVTLINTYLGGDMSVRFGLKVLIVLLVATGIFLHFMADLRGYWTADPKKAQLVGYGTLALVIATVVAGVVIMGSPAQVRLYRFDDQKINDLQSIQWQVVNYWQTYERLPQSLDDLTDTISGYAAPKDPQTGEAYRYRIVEGMMPHFELCATFNASTQNITAADLVEPRAMAGKDLMQDSWYHDSGEVCFIRTIDPERYPPYPDVKAIR